MLRLMFCFRACSRWCLGLMVHSMHSLILSCTQAPATEIDRFSCFIEIMLLFLFSRIEQYVRLKFFFRPLLRTSMFFEGLVGELDEDILSFVFENASLSSCFRRLLYLQSIIFGRRHRDILAPSQIFLIRYFYQNFPRSTKRLSLTPASRLKNASQNLAFPELLRNTDYTDLMGSLHHD